MSKSTEVQYVSDADGKPTAVLVPIAPWREIAAERETLLRSETMKRRLLEARIRANGISLEDACERLGIRRQRVRRQGVRGECVVSNQRLR